MNPKKEIEFKETSNKGPLVGAFLIVLVIVAYVLFLRPMAEDVSAVQADIVSKTDKVEVAREEVVQFEKAQKQLEVATEPARLEILKAVPTEIDQDEVIRDLIKISDIYDIGLSSVSFGKSSSQKEGVSVLRVSASFEGNYNDLVNFLEGLEQNARLFKVDSISVQVSRPEFTGIERVNFSLTIETFFQE